MRVLVADDHAVVRLALRYILAELDAAIEIQEAADARDALAALSAGPVDLVISDLFMPHAGPDYLRRLVKAAAPAPVVAFTVSENTQHAQAALTAGARGFVPKTTGASLIVNILRLILAGGVYLPPAMSLAASTDREPAHDRTSNDRTSGARTSGDRSSGARRALGLPGDGPLSEVDLAPNEWAPAEWAQPDGSRSSAGRLPQLTPRQLEVLELLAQGLSNADIGARLGLNLSTVKSHVTGVLRALNVSSRTQAVLAFKQADWPPSH